MRQKFFTSLSLICLISAPIYTQTIAEKKASLQTGNTDLDPKTFQTLGQFNQEIGEKKALLRGYYDEARRLHAMNASEAAFQELLQKIQLVRKEIQAIEEEWQVIASEATETEKYALWHQPETTIEELVINYGSQDYVYLIPTEVGDIKLSVNSNIPIPRAVWSTMLEAILSQNGIGVQQVSPYLRKLYLIKDGKILVKGITNKPGDLEFMPESQSIAFLLSPQPDEVKKTYFFLNKFANPQSTNVQQVGRDILLVGPVSDIQDLLKMYDFVAANRTERDHKLIPLTRVRAEDMARILQAMFDQVIEQSDQKKKTTDKSKIEDVETNGLKIVVLDKMSQGIFLVGSRQEIARAEQMIKEIESQFSGAREKTIYWYNVKHSVAEDLANILQHIYTTMVRERVGVDDRRRNQMQNQQQQQQQQTPEQNGLERAREGLTPINVLNFDPFYQEGAVAIDPAPVGLIPPRTGDNKVRQNENFIVDPKTGSIVMVVEKDLLPKIKETARRLDVPKKMVQLEVLLFEKRITDRTNMGLNLLRMGGCASDTNSTCLRWNDPNSSNVQTGILDFLLSRVKNNGIPAFDLAYSFLISQDDVSINANPSVVTLNQVPAKIAILEERSINTGINFIETTGTATPRDSFTRAQYGITLEITPTIHLAADGEWSKDDIDYVTLDTNVNFDTFQQDTLNTDRPIVIRRNIHNEVLIPDGQTVVLGGLRRKDTQDRKEKIPYLGEIPGFGKFFSRNQLTDTSVEMFIFITPKIIRDPQDDLQRVKCEQMCRRPGDSPDFLCQLNLARWCERKQLLAGTIKMLFGPGQPCYYPTKNGVCKEPCFSNYETPWECKHRGEYDGR